MPYKPTITRAEIDHLLAHDTDSFLQILNQRSEGWLMDTLSMEYVDVGTDYLTMRMPVTEKVCLPFGYLHGGATLALAETAGGGASFLVIDPQLEISKGLHIEGNHIRSVKQGDGYVYAKANLVHSGRRTNIWSVEVRDDRGKLVSLCKVTNMVVPLQDILE